MILEPKDARLILCLLGEGESAIRPGQFTGQHVNTLKNTLRAFSGEDRKVIFTTDPDTMIRSTGAFADQTEAHGITMIDAILNESPTPSVTD